MGSPMASDSTDAQAVAAKGLALCRAGDWDRGLQLLGAVLLLLFLSPIADWWASAGLTWTTPYALWLLVILGALLIHRLDDSDEP